MHLLLKVKRELLLVFQEMGESEVEEVFDDSQILRPLLDGLTVVLIDEEECEVDGVVAGGVFYDHSLHILHCLGLVTIEEGHHGGEEG